MRTKTYFKSGEIAHVWANQQPPFNRIGNSPGNMRFSGDSFYSYGTVIARHLTHKGRHAIVRDTASLSISTSNHQSHVWRAIPPGIKVFTVECAARGQYLFHEPHSLAAHYANHALRLIASLDDIAPAKKDGTHSKVQMRKLCEITVRAKSLLLKAAEAAEFFRIAKPKACRLLKTRATFFESASQGALEGAEKMAEARRKRDAKREKERKADAERRCLAIISTDPADEDAIGNNWHYRHSAYSPQLAALVNPEIIAKLKGWSERRQAVLAERWRNGDRYSHPDATLLRIDGDEIETSKGARVSIDDGRTLYQLLAKRRHEDYAPLAEISVGHYRFIKSTPTEIHIGCHVIPWSEVDAIAARLGWNAGN